MSRIRTIKPEFWRNEKLSALPEATLILAAALLNYADDEGFFNANAQLVKAECSPLRDPSVTIHCSLMELSNAGYLRLGTGPDGRRYGRVLKFTEHQRINRPKPSKISRLQIAWDASVTSQCAVTDESPLEQGTGNREQGTGNREQGSSGGEDFVSKVSGEDHERDHADRQPERPPAERPPPEQRHGEQVTMAVAMARVLADARARAGGHDPSDED